MRWIWILGLLLFVFGCSKVITNTSSGYRVKGKTTIHNFVNSSLNGKSIIKGYIYSRSDSTFLKGANIIISDQNGTTSNEDGYFIKELLPGAYNIKAEFIGHTKEEIEFEIKSNEEIMIIFELGTDVVY